MIKKYLYCTNKNIIKQTHLNYFGTGKARFLGANPTFFIQAQLDSGDARDASPPACYSQFSVHCVQTSVESSEALFTGTGCRLAGVAYTRSKYKTLSAN